MDEKQNNKDAAAEFSLAQTQQKINDLQIRNDGRTANCIGPNCGDVGLADLKGLCEACYNMLDKYNREKKSPGKQTSVIIIPCLSKFRTLCVPVLL